jgi:hypothetical protein
MDDSDDRIRIRDRNPRVCEEMFFRRVVHNVNKLVLCFEC